MPDEQNTDDIIYTPVGGAKSAAAPVAGVDTALPQQNAVSETQQSQAKNQAAPDDGMVYIPAKQFEQRLSSEYDPEDIRKSTISGAAHGTYRLPVGISKLVDTAAQEIAYKEFQWREKRGEIPNADEAFQDWLLGREQAYEDFYKKNVPQVPEHVKEKFASDLDEAKAQLNDPEYYEKSSLPKRAAINITRPIVDVAETVGYEPKTYLGAGAYETGAGASELMLYKFLGKGGLLGRGFAGGASGLLGESLRQKAEGTPWEPWAQLGGAFAGQILGEGVAGLAGKLPIGKWWGAEKELEKSLLSSLESDANNGFLRGTPDEIKAKLKSGEPINIGDVLSPESKTLKVLEDFAAHVPGKKSNEMVAQKLSDLSTTKILNGGELKQGLQDAANAEATSVFSALRDVPESSNILPSVVGKITENPHVKKAMEEVANSVKNVEFEAGKEIVPPKVTPGKPAVEAEERIVGFDKNFNPILEKVGQEATPDIVSGGNINYWHAVKKKIDDLFEQTGDPIYLNIKKQLINGIDNAVDGGYSAALGESAVKYNQLSAMTAGYNLMGKINTIKTEDILKRAGSLEGDAKKYFVDGILARVNEDASKGNGVQSIYNQIIAKDSPFSLKLQKALGEDAYNEISGAVIQQQTLNRAANFWQKAYKIAEPALEKKGYAAGAIGGGLAVYDYITGNSGDHTKALAGLGAFLAGRQFAMNSLEKKIAPLALDYIRNPDGGKKLAQLIEKSPEARTLLQKIEASFLRASLAAGRGYGLSEQESPEPFKPVGFPSPNANGGRIAYKSGGRVKNARAVAQSLLREIDQTRKMIGKKTEDILSMPDDAVATALTIARGNV